MPKHTDDELFRGSVMTFGQHLGELRICLWKAILGLAIGFGVGLCVGQYVVRFIETPLTAALTKFYEGQSEAKLNEQFSGKIPPEQLDNIRQRHMVFDEVYVDPRSIMDSLREKFPEAFTQPAPSATGVITNDTVAQAGSNGQNLLPLKIWHKTSDVTQIVGMNPMEAFMVYMKASLLVGAVLSSPWVFYQLWIFVAAGLYHRERALCARVPAVQPGAIHRRRGVGVLRRVSGRAEIPVSVQRLAGNRHHAAHQRVA